MGKIKILGTEFETIGKPKIVPYNSVTKDLLDAHKKAKKGTRNETFSIGENPNLSLYCKSCFDSIEYERSEEYNFLCENCASLIMVRDDEHSEAFNLDTNLQ